MINYENINGGEKGLSGSIRCVCVCVCVCVSDSESEILRES